MFYFLLYWFSYKAVCEMILGVQSPRQTENLNNYILPSSPIRSSLMK